MLRVSNSSKNFCCKLIFHNSSCCSDVINTSLVFISSCIKCWENVNRKIYIFVFVNTFFIIFCLCCAFHPWTLRCLEYFELFLFAVTCQQVAPPPMWTFAICAVSFIKAPACTTDFCLFYNVFPWYLLWFMKLLL